MKVKFKYESVKYNENIIKDLPDNTTRQELDNIMYEHARELIDKLGVTYVSHEWEILDDGNGDN